MSDIKVTDRKKKEIGCMKTLKCTEWYLVVNEELKKTERRGKKARKMGCDARDQYKCKDKNEMLGLGQGRR
jgi:hypothetical protein